jgi:hypothetical protein
MEFRCHDAEANSFSAVPCHPQKNRLHIYDILEQHEAFQGGVELHYDHSNKAIAIKNKQWFAVAHTTVLSRLTCHPHTIPPMNVTKVMAMAPPRGALKLAAVARAR